MTNWDFDAAVVGAGAVGLATGFALASRGLSTVVLESANGIGQGVSSRNSEVVHGGLYYPSGSLKAELCVAGRRLLYDFLDVHGVPFDRCGKLVVATDGAEETRLAALLAQARENGVENIRTLARDEALEMEPRLAVSAALYSPQSGVFDSHAYMLALQGEIEDRGGIVALRSPMERAEPMPGGGFRLRTGGGEPATLTAAHLVTASGLAAQDVASRIDGYPSQRIPNRRLGKGNYFLLQAPAPFSRLVYPLPVPGALGVHYRRDLGGQARFGPDLQFVEEEDYKVDESRLTSFYSEVRRFWPGLPDGALAPDYVGLRPKIHGPGEPQPDFLLDGPADHGVAGLVCMFGIESPGLTASLAIGRRVCEMLDVPGGSDT